MEDSKGTMKTNLQFENNYSATISDPIKIEVC